LATVFKWTSHRGDIFIVENVPLLNEHTCICNMMEPPHPSFSTTGTGYLSYLQTIQIVGLAKEDQMPGQPDLNP
jgi:hypothetical protein